MKIHRIAPKRTFVQTILILLYLIFPLLSINGNPLFRIDILQHTLFMAGAAIRIDQFYLVLLATLLFVIMFLLLTVLVGRAWCGWMCPQTLLNELVEAGEKRVRALLPDRLAPSALHLVALPVSLLFATATLLWFMSPSEVMNRLPDFTRYPVSASCFVITALILYLDLALVKRSFCKNYCPYGRFQVALQDNATLNLTFIEATRHACIQCAACVRACPMGIDIRDGFQIECISCGRCIDACRTVMERRSYPEGLIAYHFGATAGGKANYGSKTIVLALLVSLLTTALVWGVRGKSENAFAVQRNPLIETKSLPDGVQIQAWKVIIGNRGEHAARFSVQARSASGAAVKLLGPVSDMLIEPNENRTVSFFLRLDPADMAGKRIELTLLRGLQAVAKAEVTP